MQFSSARIQRIRTVQVIAGVVVVSAIAPATAAFGEERAFLVTLANSPKQYPGPTRVPPGQPTGGLPIRQPIQEDYFDRIDPDVGSFAEYWEEISYGDVTISGYVTDWINLPWAIQPPLVDPTRDHPVHGPPVDDNINDPVLRNSPANFFDQNQDGWYRYGQGEQIIPYAAVIIDTDGNPLGIDNGPYFVGPGSGHVTTSGAEVWKPGERFVDMDEDNKWDGLDEANNMMDWDGNGQPDLRGPWIDLNEDGEVGSSTGCVYLSDSDNDGNPNCCPNGPWDSDETHNERHSGCARFGYPQYNDPTFLKVCPATRWEAPFGEFSDCNGNLIPDVCDIDPNDNPQAEEDCAALIAAGYTGPQPPLYPMSQRSYDRSPLGQDEVGRPVPAPDGIPDECQYVNWNANGGAGCCADPTHCVTCDDLTGRYPVQRCEYHDSNLDGHMDIVEPFENFMRRWDHCFHAPEASPPNRFEPQAHWIKVYDPFSPFAGTSLTCFSPSYTVDYGDDSYIRDNYPALGKLCSASRSGCQADEDCPEGEVCRSGVEELVEESYGRLLIGSHDPYEKLPMAECKCANGLYCNDQIPDLPEGYVLPERACVIGLHVEYDPPDAWINAIAENGPGEEMVYTTKMQAAPGSGEGEAEFVMGEFTPEPAWHEQAWGDRYRMDNPEYDPGEPPGPDNPPTLPRPAPPWPSDGDENIILMQPFTDADAEDYDPGVNRRFFKANAGGANGDGTGWIGCCAAYDPQIIFESGDLGPIGFEQVCNHSILPEEADGEGDAPIFYDGWVEHDDLPSSKYHRAGDQRLGEVTSPYNDSIWGHDRGSHDPGVPPIAPDGVIPPAGPYATSIHGNFGLDAGNLLTLELLTWRTAPPFNDGLAWEHDLDFDGVTRVHPYAGPFGENLGFRDYNLDGLVDLGESRYAGSENYVADSQPGTVNNGTHSVYPFNRLRVVEDCIEVLDELIDFDDFLDPAALTAHECNYGTPSAQIPEPLQGLGASDVIFPDGVNSGIVLLPPDSHQEGDFLFPAYYHPVHTEDGPVSDDTSFPPGQEGERIIWNSFSHDLVRGIDVEFVEDVVPNENSQTAYAAHQYLHTWEAFPDTYDYDIYGPPGSVINCPIGRWDIMARGGLVHPLPIFKGRPCTKWIEPVDLTTILTPGVETTLTLPPYEYVRDKSAYFLENEYYLGERYYFWSAGSGFDKNMPGEGLLILHTDGTVGPEPQSLPLGGGLRFPYLIVQADGEHELEDGTDCGDDGDPWPGSTGTTTFDCLTDPAARWYTQNLCTGLEISDVVPDGLGAILLRLNWVPTSIPGLRFIDPPGGFSVDLPPDVIYRVRAEVNDVYGGTWMRFFFTDEQSNTAIDPDGANYIGSIRKAVPGLTLHSVDWNIAGLLDGEYRVFAELIPGAGDDGLESQATTPRPGRNNAGDGPLVIDDVNANEVISSGELGFLLDPLTFVAFNAPNDLVDFASAGVTVGDQLTFEGFATRSPALRTISGISLDGFALTLSAPITATLPPGGGRWLIVRADATARFETWTVECIDDAGAEWMVTSSLTQPRPEEDDPNEDPYPHAFTNVSYTSIGGEVTFTITEGSEPFARGDRFSLTTTGVTAISRRVVIIDGQVRATLGDWNYDGVVDLEDYRQFSVCLGSSGPNHVAPSGHCRMVFDFDGDQNIDLVDFRGFVAAFNASAP